MRQLVTTNVIGALSNQINPNTAHQVNDLRLAARTLNQEVVIFPARNERDIEGSFAELAERNIKALVVTADGFLISREDQIVALAAKYRIATMHPQSQHVVAGGLMSYAPIFARHFVKQEFTSAGFSMACNLVICPFGWNL